MDDTLWSLAWLVLGVALLVVVTFAFRKLSPLGIDKQISVADNPAAGLVLACFMAGVLIIFAGAVLGPEMQTLTPQAVGQQMLIVSGYTLGGALGLVVGMVVLDKLVLTRFAIRKELIDDRNVGTGAVVGGATLATALIVAGSVHGQGGGWDSALTFFALGQVALILFARVYQLLTRYDLHEQIEQDNAAAGVAFGMTLVALGTILMRAAGGDFISWEDNLYDFAYYAVGGTILLAILQKLGDLLLLPGTTLAKEIAQDRNLNAAWLEGTFALAAAVLIFILW